MLKNIKYLNEHRERIRTEVQDAARFRGPKLEALLKQEHWAYRMDEIEKGSDCAAHVRANKPDESLDWLVKVIMAIAIPAGMFAGLWLFVRVLKWMWVTGWIF